MELTETIKSINQQLVDLFGIDTVTGQAIFRVVWSEDQFEKRLTDCTSEGLSLMYPQVRELPKYNQWIHEKYVLERLVAIPEVNQSELPSVKISYEPVWVFEDKYSGYLPPRLDACKFIIDALYAAMGKKSLRKYVDEEAQYPEEHREMRVNQLQVELFGNETDVTDALTYHEGIVVPRNYRGES